MNTLRFEIVLYTLFVRLFFTWNSMTRLSYYSIWKYWVDFLTSKIITYQVDFIKTNNNHVILSHNDLWIQAVILKKDHSNGGHVLCLKFLFEKWEEKKSNETKMSILSKKKNPLIFFPTACITKLQLAQNHLHIGFW